MCMDKSIKFDPEKSVLKYKAGNEIKFNEADFLLLYRAFFAELKVNISEPRSTQDIRV